MTETACCAFVVENLLLWLETSVPLHCAKRVGKQPGLPGAFDKLLLCGSVLEDHDTAQEDTVLSARLSAR